MKINVDLILQLRRARSWTQDELATASGLNLRTIQRIENEAAASLQSVKALAAAFDVSVRDLEIEESEMINELLGQEVVITTTYIGALHSVKGKVLEIQAPWLKLMYKDKPLYINLNQIIQVRPQ
ncbi:MAG: helix-turn-helix domain-containing protein [Burkholderiaceae bacterium]|nr:helix-turn-helix domain-containing protein [Burkholderiaceae bacterium]